MSIEEGKSTIKSQLLFKSLLDHYEEVGRDVTTYIHHIISKNQQTSQISRRKRKASTIEAMPSDDQTLWNLVVKRRQSSPTNKLTPVKAGSESGLATSDPNSIATFLPSKRDIEKFNLRHVIDNFVLFPNSLCHFVVFPTSKTAGPAVKEPTGVTPLSPVVAKLSPEKLLLHQFPKTVQPGYTVMPICLSAHQSRMIASDQKRGFDVFGRRERKHGYAICQLNYLRASHRFKTLHRIRDLRKMLRDSMARVNNSVDGETDDGSDKDEDDEEDDDDENEEDQEPDEPDESENNEQEQENDEPLPSFVASRLPPNLRHATGKATNTVPVLFDYPVCLRNPLLVSQFAHLPSLSAATSLINVAGPSLSIANADSATPVYKRARTSRIKLTQAEKRSEHAQFVQTWAHLFRSNLGHIPSL